MACRKSDLGTPRRKYVETWENGAHEFGCELSRVSRATGRQEGDHGVITRTGWPEVSRSGLVCIQPASIGGIDSLCNRLVYR